MSNFELIKNKKLLLEPPNFTCDGELAPHLKNYDMLNFMNGFFFTGIVGRPASGKTSFLISLLNGRKEKRVFRKVFDHVIIVMPTNSIASMKKNIFKNHLKEKMFNELTYDTISNIYSKLETATAEKETTLLIMDDVGASLKNPAIKTIMRQIIFNRRHLKVNIIILLQSFMSLEKEIRKLFSNIITFKPSKTEMENLMNEMFEMKKDVALELMNYIFVNKHDYLFLNIESQRMFKDFDEIIIHDSDTDEIKSIT